MSGNLQRQVLHGSGNNRARPKVGVRPGTRSATLNPEVMVIPFPSSSPATTALDTIFFRGFVDIVGRRQRKTFPSHPLSSSTDGLCHAGQAHRVREHFPVRKARPRLFVPVSGPLLSLTCSPSHRRLPGRWCRVAAEGWRAGRAARNPWAASRPWRRIKCDFLLGWRTPLHGQGAPDRRRSPWRTPRTSAAEGFPRVRSADPTRPSPSSLNYEAFCGDAGLRTAAAEVTPLGLHTEIAAGAEPLLHGCAGTAGVGSPRHCGSVLVHVYMLLTADEYVSCLLPSLIPLPATAPAARRAR
jgi:hypothetical protein